MEQNHNKWRGFTLCVLAITAIVVMEVVAISHGMNGVMLTAAAAAVSGIAGTYLGVKIKKA